MRASARAVHLLRCLVAGGVRELVLAPGSRSAPLAIAAYAADVAGALRLHVRVDERPAGFLALGLAMGSREPVAVVTTSGTAVANLLPAVMEACHSGRHVVVVSADRPAALRGTGANQTTWQAGLFGRFAPCADLAVDASAATVERAVREACERDGPSQLNVQLDAPLVPDAEPWWPAMPHGAAEAASGMRPTAAAAAASPAPVGEALPAGPRTVLVAGDGAGPAARQLAEAAGLPLLAEPTSGARAGPNAIRTYRLLLGTRLGEQVEQVVVLGHPTLSRPVTALLSRPDVEVLSFAGPGGVATDPARRARHLGSIPSPQGLGDSGWLASWRQADTTVAKRLDDFVDELPELDALHVARAVADALHPGGTLVVGSSNPVRDLDLMLAPYSAQQRRRVVGNRGLSGIDGTVSTAIGVALGRCHLADGSEADTRPALALLGDLTFLHDSTGLLLGPDEPRPDLTLVVVNDDGGSIFALLEQGAPQYAAAFERVFATPTRADLEALCAASGTAYQRVRTGAQLRAALAEPARGIRVAEARVGRTDRRATAAAIAALTEDVG